MLINIMQWHAGITNFYRHAYPLIKMNKNLLSFNFDLRLILMNFFCSFFLKIYCCFMVILMQILVQIENKSFNCCHWNVNSITAHNMVKLSSIAAYNSIHRYDCICISETYLDYSVQSDDRDICNLFSLMIWDVAI